MELETKTAREWSQYLPHRKCFACDRRLGSNPHHVDTRDDQWVVVGTECYKEIKKSGDRGWVPPKGGLRLWTIPVVDWMNQGPRITGGGSNK